MCALDTFYDEQTMRTYIAACRKAEERYATACGKPVIFVKTIDVTPQPLPEPPEGEE